MPTLSPRLAHFSSLLGSVGFGAFSRTFALGSQFVVLMLLGKLLAKPDFGDFMVAFALTRVLSQGLGTGLATLLVYHVSREATPACEAALHRAAALLGGAITAVLALGLMLGATAVAGWMGKPSLAFWVRWMSPFMLFSTLLTIAAGALDGRGRITSSIMLVEFLPNLIRLLLLPALLLLGRGSWAVVGVMTVSIIVPWAWAARDLARYPQAGVARLSGWDLQYAGKLTVHSFAAMQVQGIDMLVVGWLFSSTSAADYAIASRVAALIPFFQQIIVRRCMTNAGRALHNGDMAAVQHEINTSRRLSVPLVGATAIAAMIAYPLLLAFLGSYQGSAPLLATLAAGAVYRSYFPGGDALIRVSGHADFSLRIMLTSVAVLLLLPLLTAPLLGTQAVAVSMLFSGIVLNPVMARFARRELGVTLIKRADALPMLIGAAGFALAGAAGPHLILWYGAALLVAVSIGVAYLVERCPATKATNRMAL